MITKDGRDTPIEKLTADNYIVPKGEERYYHAVIEVKQFDPKTGRRLSTPRVQKFGKKIFETSVLASLKKQGYEVTILHNPKEWIAKQQAQAAEQARAEAEAKAKAEKEKFDAAVAAAVAKVLAEKEQQEAEKAKAEAERKAEQEALLAAEEKAKAEAAAKAEEKASQKAGSK